MNYKETLFFVGKCLTINHEEHNKIIIEEQLKSNTVNWDNVVKVSTAQYVFPALYCNLKRADFLHYLPSDLVEYMQYITDLNRERNKQIIAQAKEINELLLANNITPIFLKGTAFLLQGLYEDIAERMVGDIDFLVKDDDFIKTISTLKDNGYFKFHKNKTDNTILNRHYPKMIKKDRIASIEVHYKMVSRKPFKHFNYNFIKEEVQKTEKIQGLSNENNILLTILNAHINDFNDYYKNIKLKSCYDLLKLSIKASTKSSIKKLNKNIPLNNFLHSCYLALGKPNSIEFTENIESKKYIQKVLLYINDNQKNRKNRKKTDIFLHSKDRIYFTLNLFTNRKYRLYLLNRILNLLKIQTSIITRTH